MTWSLYREWDPRGLWFLVFGGVVAEAICLLRWRLAVVCRACGFDAIVYKRKPEEAAERVRVYLQKRREDPESLLRPALHLPVLKKRVDPTKDLSGSGSMVVAPRRHEGALSREV